MFEACRSGTAELMWTRMYDGSKQETVTSARTCAMLVAVTDEVHGGPLDSDRTHSTVRQK